MLRERREKYALARNWPWIGCRLRHPGIGRGIPFRSIFPTARAISDCDQSSSEAGYLLARYSHRTSLAAGPIQRSQRHAACMAVNEADRQRSRPEEAAKRIRCQKGFHGRIVNRPLSKRPKRCLLTNMTRRRGRSGGRHARRSEPSSDEKKVSRHRASFIRHLRGRNYSRCRRAAGFSTGTK